jgi:hypothetical protein
MRCRSWARSSPRARRGLTDFGLEEIRVEEKRLEIRENQHLRQIEKYDKLREEVFHQGAKNKSPARRRIYARRFGDYSQRIGMIERELSRVVKELMTLTRVRGILERQRQDPRRPERPAAPQGRGPDEADHPPRGRQDLRGGLLQKLDLLLGVVNDPAYESADIGNEGLEVLKTWEQMDEGELEFGEGLKEPRRRAREGGRPEGTKEKEAEAGEAEPHKMGLFEFIGMKKKELTLEQVKREEIKLGIRETQTLAKLEKLEKEREEIFAKGLKIKSPPRRRQLARLYELKSSGVKTMERELSLLSKEITTIAALKLALERRTNNKEGVSRILERVDEAKLMTYLEDDKISQEMYLEKLNGVLSTVTEGANQITEDLGKEGSEVMDVWQKMDEGEIENFSDGLKMADKAVREKEKRDSEMEAE